MADNTISVTLEINTDKGKKEVEGALKSISVASEQVGKEVEQNVSSGFNKASDSAKNFGDIVKGVFAGQLLAQGLTSVISSISSAFSEGVSSALEAEKAQQKLTFALAATGDASEATLMSFRAYADEIEQLTNVEAEAVLQSISVGRTIGLTNDQIKEATSAAIGLSKVMGTDFNSAFLAVTQTLSGIASKSLKNLSGDLRELDEESLKSGQGITILAQKFGQFAGADLQTASGQLEALKRSFGDVFEEIANFFIKSDTLKTASSSIKTFLDDVTAGIAGLRTFFQGAEGTEGLYQQLDQVNQGIDAVNAKLANAEVLKNYGVNITDLKVRLGELKQQKAELTGQLDALNAKNEQAANSTGTLKEATKGLTDEQNKLKESALALGLSQEQALNQQYQKNIQTLQQARDQQLITEAQYNQRVIELTNQRDGQLSQMEMARQQQRLQALGIGSDETIQLELKYMNEQMLLQQKFEQELLTEEEFLLRRDALQTQYEQNSLMKTEQNELQKSVLFENSRAAFAKSAQGMLVSSTQLAAGIQNSLANGISRSFTQVGVALKNGQNGFEAFKDGLKSTMGDIVSVIGDAFIKTGAGMLVPFTPFFNPASGAGLIAAGAALKVFSGMLGQSGGGTTGGGLGATGAPVVETAPNPLTQPLGDEQLQQVNRGPNISVNIQGDVLDSNESGLRIVELINSAFDQQGVALNA